MQESSKTITWQEFLEKSEPLRWHVIDKALKVFSRGIPGVYEQETSYTVETWDAKFWCPNCEAYISHSARPHTSFSLKDQEVSTLHPEYECPAPGCDHSHNVCYHVKLDGATLLAMKFGQEPVFEIDLDESFHLLVKDNSRELEWLRKGRRCEQHHLGAGAFAYYRMVVEALRVRLFTLLKDLYVDPEHIAHMDEAITMPSFDDSMKLVSDIVPPCFSVGVTINPLKTLYELTSDGLHASSNITDKEILDDAEAVRLSLVMLLRAVQNERDLKAQGKKTAHRIQDALERKRARNSAQSTGAAQQEHGDADDRSTRTNGD